MVTFGDPMLRNFVGSINDLTHEESTNQIDSKYKIKQAISGSLPQVILPI